MKANKTTTKTKAVEPPQKSGPFFKKATGQGFFQPSGQGIQPKLTVGSPNDVYEQEADQMADRVVKGLSAGPMAGGGRDGDQGGLRRKPIFESENDPADGIRRKCAACEQEEQVQRKETGAGGSTAGASVESGIARSKGSGSSLPETTRSHMESSFGADFSGVKIHQDNEAQQMNKSLRAQAFTHGKDIYFDSGKYDPASNDGQHLLAHELTHVVQQTGKGEASKPARRKMYSAAAASAAAHAVTTGPTGGTPATATTGSPVIINDATPEQPMLQGTEDLTPDTSSVVRREPTGGGGGTGACSLTPGSATIDQVSQQCPHPSGTISRTGSDTTIAIYKQQIKENANDTFVSTLPKPLTMPKPGSRKENPTQQRKIWRDAVREAVQTKLKSYLSGINKTQSDEAKMDPQNQYKMRLKQGTGVAALVGSYQNLVDQSLIPKWSPGGSPQAFQVEHIVDYQVAGSKADDIVNLMLLSAHENNQLGAIMAEYIRNNIQTLLDHYNQYVSPNTLLTTAKDARENYTIQANDLVKVPNPLPADTWILKEFMTDSAQDSKNPLKKDNIEVTAFDKPPTGYFILKSNVASAGVILPYEKENYNVGSYQLTMHGSEEKGITEITAKLMITGPAVKDKPESKTYPLTPLGKDTKIFKVDKFGYDMSQLKINYLSLVTFEQPELDEELNVTVRGLINTPGPAFLSKTPIEVMLQGRDLSIQKTFSASELGGVGPIKVDDASLTLSLSTQNGLGASGGVDFSIAKVGKGHIDAAKDSNGFKLNGRFDFDTKTFDKASITVGYSSAKDQEGSSGWTMDGTLSIGKKVKGIEKATIKVGYADGKITLKGSADLSVPGLKSASIDATYGGGEFSLGLTANFDLKNKFITDPQVSVTLATGGDDNSGWRLGLSGSLGLNIPHLNTVRITVSYDQGTFDAAVQASKINVGKYVEGSITLGITNKPVDEATGATTGTGEGKDLRLYGSGSITVTLNPHLSVTATVKLTKDAKILISSEVKLTKQPLLPGDKLYGDTFHLFEMGTPEIPIFSIGVGDVFLKVEGEGRAMYSIGVPLLSVDLKLKDTDIFDPSTMNVDAKITPEISAEAGIDLEARLIFGARVLILVVEAHVGGTLMLHAKATASGDLDLSWSPDKGVTFKGAKAKLHGDINLAGKITGGLAVKLDLWIKTVGIWDKDWDLATLDFGSLGSLDLEFPLNIGADGNPVPPSPEEMKPKTPFSDKDAAGNWVRDKPGGGDKPEKKDVEEQKPSIHEIMAGLPAIGPTNPAYQTQRSRHFFFQELQRMLPNFDWSFVKADWYMIEFWEFQQLSNKLRQPVSDVDKLAVLHQFAVDHVMVEPVWIQMLEQEIKQMEQPTNQSK